MKEQNKRTRSFWKKPWGWVAFLVGLTCLQLLVLFGADQFLKPPSIEALASVDPDQHKLIRPKVPEDAVQTVYSGDNLYAAYTTADEELVIVKGHEETFRESVGEVKYMEWLGESNALAYFVGGDHLIGYLLHANGTEPTQIYTWYGNTREVVKTYFSPYMEFLYIEIRNGERTEVYKFDAVDGISQLPLGDVKVQDIQYDDKTDIMKLTTPEGAVWRYEEDRLYRPDGSEVKQANPVHHHKPGEREYSNKK